MRCLLFLPLILRIGIAALFGNAEEGDRPFLAVPHPVVRELEPVLDRALAAYNEGDGAAFCAEFSRKAPGILGAGAYERLVEGVYKAEFGALLSKALEVNASALDKDWGQLVYRADFEKAKVKLSANFAREAGTPRLMQIRFEKR